MGIKSARSQPSILTKKKENSKLIGRIKNCERGLLNENIFLNKDKLKKIRNISLKNVTEIISTCQSNLKLNLK